MRRSIASLARWRSGALLALTLAGCRIDAAAPRWTEAHGQGYFKSLAASSRGVAALGAASGVYSYPGSWGRPWLPAWDQPAVSIAATDSATYVLQQSGDVFRIEGAPRGWTHIPPRPKMALFGGPPDRLYAILDGTPHRIDAAAIAPLECGVPARHLVVRESAVLVVREDGAVWRASGAECARVALPGPVDSLALTRKDTFALRQGRAFYVEHGRFEPLPEPLRYRQYRAVPVALAEITASKNTLWALSADGLAFQLAMP